MEDCRLHGGDDWNAVRPDTAAAGLGRSVGQVAFGLWKDPVWWPGLLCSPLSSRYNPSLLPPMWYREGHYSHMPCTPSPHPHRGLGITWWHLHSGCLDQLGRPAQQHQLYPESGQATGSPPHTPLMSPGHPGQADASGHKASSLAGTG